MNDGQGDEAQNPIAAAVKETSSSKSAGNLHGEGPANFEDQKTGAD